MKDFGHLNYGINPKVPAERSVEWVNSLDGHGNEDVTATTYKSYSQKAQNKRFVIQLCMRTNYLPTVIRIVSYAFEKLYVK